MSANPKLFEFYDGGDVPENRCLETEVTLRDLFAMAALAGIVQNEPAEWHVDRRDGVRGGAIAAGSAYVLADAMLAERAKGRP